MTGLEHHLLSALPHLSPRMGSVWQGLVLRGGSTRCATKVARSIGLSSRFAFARMMRREGLPALHELAAWVRLLGWVAHAELGTTSLFAIAIRSGIEPAVCYRTVKRLTGLSWVELSSLGFYGTLQLFIRRCEAIRLEAGLEVRDAVLAGDRATP